MNSSVLVSIIVPVYNEGENLPALIAELATLDRERRGDRFQFVLVDDGSTDDTWPKLCEWANAEPRLVAVRLAGNSGSHRAGRAGLSVASGDVMLFFAGDLQERADLIEMCLRKWHETRSMVVMMVPEFDRPRDRWLDGVAARAVYAILHCASRIHRGLSVQAVATLIDRVAADAFLSQRSRFALQTTFALQQKFPYDVVHYRIAKRSQGRSKWKFRSKLALMLDMFIECSVWFTNPLLVALLCGGLYVSLEMINLAATGLEQLRNRASSICVASAVVVLFELLNLYVYRLYTSLNAGPLYVIREIRRGAAWEAAQCTTDAKAKTS